MSPFIQFALMLAVIILAAKLAGYLAARFHQPVVLGELLVGFILGPSLINVLHLSVVKDVGLSETINNLGQIGVLLLMFVAGLELHLDELRRHTRASALAGILGALFSVLLGWSVGRLFGMNNMQAVFLGLTLGASSVSISAQTLMELKQLRSRVGLSLLGAAVFDDVLIILLLSLFFAFTSNTSSLIEIGLVLARILIFFALAFLFGLWALPRLIQWVRHLPISQSLLSLALVIALAYAIAAELIGGMAAITGAFLAGLMFARSPEKESLEPRIHALAYGFFVPIFFVNIGLSVNIFTVGQHILLAIMIISAAIVGKLIGAGLGGRAAGLNLREAAQLSLGMVPRAEVSLIAASAGLSAGLMRPSDFSAIAAMVIVCTLITPPLLRALFHQKELP